MTSGAGTRASAGESRSLGAAVASAAGPVVGGFLTLLSWRSIFFINLPAGVVTLLLLLRVPRSPRRAVPFDWTGQVAAVLGMGALTYGLIEGGADGFGATRVLAALATAVVALAAFLLTQARGAHPMVPLELFRSRPVAVSVSVGFAFTVGFYGLVFLLSLYLQRWGGPVEEIRLGDVIWFPPGEKHWHGAAPTTAMTHIAIQEHLDGKTVEWMEKVGDEQHQAGRERR